MCSQGKACPQRAGNLLPLSGYHPVSYGYCAFLQLSARLEYTGRPRRRRPRQAILSSQTTLTLIQIRTPPLSLTAVRLPKNRSQCRQSREIQSKRQSPGQRDSPAARHRRIQPQLSESGKRGPGKTHFPQILRRRTRRQEAMGKGKCLLHDYAFILP